MTESQRIQIKMSQTREAANNEVKLTGSKTEIVPKSWTITHEASGMFICDARNKAKCVWTANKLKDLVDWTNEKPADEIKSKGIRKMVESIINERP